MLRDDGVVISHERIQHGSSTSLSPRGGGATRRSHSANRPTELGSSSRPRTTFGSCVPNYSSLRMAVARTARVRPKKVGHRSDGKGPPDGHRAVDLRVHLEPATPQPGVAQRTLAGGPDGIVGVLSRRHEPRVRTRGLSGLIRHVQIEANLNLADRGRNADDHPQLLVEVVLEERWPVRVRVAHFPTIATSGYRELPAGRRPSSGATARIRASLARRSASAAQPRR